MKNCYLLAILLFAIQLTAFSQNVSIRGRVKNNADSALAGVSVTIKGTVSSYITNDRGEFMITKLNLPAELIFSSVGYESQTLALKITDTARFITIKLSAAEVSLSEVVVIGYGTAKRKHITGSVGTVRLRGAASLPMKALEGKVAGVASRKTTTVKREPAIAAYTTPEGRLDAMEESPRIHSKVLTAGELSDFKKWNLWGGYSWAEFKAWSKHWGLAPVKRYCVQVQNKDHKAIPGETVCLINTETADTVWRAVTDNTGKAELWANFDMKEEAQNRYAIVCRNETLRSPAAFENGINRITLRTSCAHSAIANIAFVVDATGSMGDEIKYLQEELKDVIAITSARNKDLKLRIGSVFYRDKSDEYLTRFIDFQNDPAPLMEFINAQSARGGGDYQEAVEDALTTALDSMHWDSDARAKIIFLVLDAPPHDAAKVKMQQLMRQAATMGVRIVPIVCSGVDKSTEFLMRALALATNGSYVFLTDDSGVGGKHLKPTTDDYKVELLNDLLQRVIAEMVYMEPCNDAGKPEVPVTPDNNAKISVYPNPSAGRIQIKASEAIKEMYITDFTGKVLEKIAIWQKMHNWQTDLSRYPSGTYLIRYFTGQKGWGAEKVVLIK